MGQVVTTTKLPSLRRTRRGMLVISMLLPLAAHPAVADQVMLSPSAAEVTIRAYGLGLIPFDGKFTRFRGIMRYDPGPSGNCQVMLEIDPTSLAMSDPARSEEVTGPEFLDAGNFPQMAYDGACQGRMIVGTLRMHGEAHPFALELDRASSRMTAEGHLHRADWGISKHPFKVGSTLRIRVEVATLSAGSKS